MIASKWNATVDIGVDPSQPCMVTSIKIYHQEVLDISGILKFHSC